MLVNGWKSLEDRRRILFQKLEAYQDLACFASGNRFIGILGKWFFFFFLERRCDLFKIPAPFYWTVFDPLLLITHQILSCWDGKQTFFRLTAYLQALKPILPAFVFGHLYLTLSCFLGFDLQPGYERLCCLHCIQPRDHNFATTCACRVPKHLREAAVIECVHCGCQGCASGD